MEKLLTLHPLGHHSGLTSMNEGACNFHVVLLSNRTQQRVPLWLEGSSETRASWCGVSPVEVRLKCHKTSESSRDSSSTHPPLPHVVRKKWAQVHLFFFISTTFQALSQVWPQSCWPVTLHAFPLCSIRLLSGHCGPALNLSLIPILLGPLTSYHLGFVSVHGEKKQEPEQRL